MDRLFPEITSVGDVMRLAKGGAIAGLVFVCLILLDSFLGGSAFGGSGAGLQGAGASPAIQLLLTGAEIAVILVLAWRVSTGRGLVSAILLMALFFLCALSGIDGGLFGVAWTIAYFGLGLLMLNAIRACLRHDAFMAEAARTN
ncbi:hypothetical protein [Hyphomonas jannaschiana]|uniref:Uncharacterized protein n=1 Tax=Hyphomonas jannaschiana VP2 TaxID=1280952 RepID=A0A059FDC8_9PROT|nr:hypothetical protein [Hyphomonas jannaschiana]KCZ88531.1 hypothetical protein HJA_09189 [Hyphomonas jannaschiana VP2]MCA8890268.1 hypothetical protein [Hyphomonas sp.]